MRRCVSSGRLPASCTGNQLLGAFGQMLNSVASQVAPGLIKDGPASGPTMAGVFVGPGNWRLDFIDGGVLVNCSFLRAALGGRGGMYVFAVPFIALLLLVPAVERRTRHPFAVSGRSRHRCLS